MPYTLDDSADKSKTDLRVVKLCCLYAELRAKSDSGKRLSPYERSQLRRLQQLLGGDPRPGRRHHRRISTLVPAVVATEAGDQHRGLVLNISGGGMYLATSAHLPAGASVKVRMGSPERARYVFPCIVRRDAAQDASPGFGLAISSSPHRVESWSAEDSWA